MFTVLENYCTYVLYRTTIAKVHYTTIAKVHYTTFSSIFHQLRESFRTGICFVTSHLLHNLISPSTRVQKKTPQNRSTLGTAPPLPPQSSPSSSSYSSSSLPSPLCHPSTRVTSFSRWSLCKRDGRGVFIFRLPFPIFFASPSQKKNLTQISPRHPHFFILLPSPEKLTGEGENGWKEGGKDI